MRGLGPGEKDLCGELLRPRLPGEGLRTAAGGGGGSSSSWEISGVIAGPIAQPSQSAGLPPIIPLPSASNRSFSTVSNGSFVASSSSKPAGTASGDAGGSAKGDAPNNGVRLVVGVGVPRLPDRRPAPMGVAGSGCRRRLFHGSCWLCRFRRPCRAVLASFNGDRLGDAAPPLGPPAANIRLVE